jgi:predicted dinucleotide-binding enzyme
MQIGIIGAGHIGSTLARHFVAVGHDVGIANSRGPETLQDLASELGERCHPMTAEDAARFGEIVVVSVPVKAFDDLPADALGGKIVIDTCNYYPARDGHISELDADETTSSELLAGRLQGASVVKAFNAIRWDHLRDDANTRPGGERFGIPIAGDDLTAKQAVDDLIEEIGFDGVDAGPLGEGGRKFQVGAPLYGAQLPSAELAVRLAD